MAWNHGYRPRQRTSQGPRGEWDPSQGLDKNLFYRTNDILNGVFKRKMKLEAGDANCTDGKNIISVNFREKMAVAVVAEEPKKEGDERNRYLLACGHTHRTTTTPAIGDEVNCAKCGGSQAYLGFEHEWSHIYFKSSLGLRKIFVDEYVKMILKKYKLDGMQLDQFLHLFVNGLDDFRVNSLQEKVYPGSAQALWDRWKRLMSQLNYDDDLLALSMAVGLGLPASPDGKYAALVPILTEATDRVRYKGPGTMFSVVRWAVDKCLDAIVNNMQPPPPAPPSPSSQGNQGGQGNSQQPQPSGGDDDDAGTPQAAPPQSPPPSSPSSSKDLDAAIATKFSPTKMGENHPTPTDSDVADLKKDPSSASMMAALGKALQGDTDINNDPTVAIGVTDGDMDQQIQKLQNMVSPGKSQDSFLTDGAKALITMLDVKPTDVAGSMPPLGPEEKFAVDRMRAAFFRVMGRQKAMRDSSGTTLDVQALIQFLAGVGEEDSEEGGSANDEVFEQEFNNQGFCYHILTDMSGSMNGGPFQQVCTAVDMLKTALDFPFVEGDLWGFRGGSGGKDGGEVWIYRYDRDCKSYLGAVSKQYHPKDPPVTYGVECGGITPMNSAIHVTMKQLSTMPAGMVKSLFILTDGSPLQQKVDGGHLQEFLLRQFVKKEINAGRARGINVYVLVIGGAISDEHCLYMFGPRKFWRRVGYGTGSDSLAKTLERLVTDNFTKYLRGR